jgi:LPPG:FO 2-phospho-L-lactate transferase
MSGVPPSATWIALSGGVGGAKLALGLAHVLGDALTVVVNTGDDFEHLGLHISPDIDTAVYTLGGLANPELGWGRRGETWTFMETIAALGGETWFRLGDGDLAMHVERTRRLKAGETLSDVTDDIARKLGISAHIAPMSDDPVATVVDTDRGRLAFQHYFVREQCRPRVRSIHFENAGNARLSPALVSALADRRLAGIIVCPSNPYLSVDPLLAVPGMREALRQPGVPIVAVSPIVGRQAIKGPTAKIMDELGLAADVTTVARHYRDVIDGFVIDEVDGQSRSRIPMPVEVAQTVMRSLEDRIALARTCLAFCGRLAADGIRRAPS